MRPGSWGLRPGCPFGPAPKDYDLTTSALPEETQRVFAAYPRIETGLRHGTVTVLLEGEPLEITTYRVDGVYSDARHPDGVTFTRSLRQDAARRDFTINAMAYAPGQGLQDFFGGQADLAQGTIRAVGRAETRFHEDALRILRALRFASVLDFTLEAETHQAALACAPLLAAISPGGCSANWASSSAAKPPGGCCGPIPRCWGRWCRRSSPWWGLTSGMPTTATMWDPHRRGGGPRAPGAPPPPGPCSSTTSASRTPFPWGRMARGTSTATPGGAWSRRRSSSPGCGRPGRCGRPSCSWSATTTPSWRRAPSGSAAGCTNWGRIASLTCWPYSGGCRRPWHRQIAQGWRGSSGWKSWLREVLSQAPCLTVRDLAVGGEDLWPWDTGGPPSAKGPPRPAGSGVIGNGFQ